MAVDRLQGALAQEVHLGMHFTIHDQVLLGEAEGGLDEGHHRSLEAERAKLEDGHRLNQLLVHVHQHLSTEGGHHVTEQRIVVAERVHVGQKLVVCLGVSVQVEAGKQARRHRCTCQLVVQGVC